jgi:hypothetical protein
MPELNRLFALAILLLAGLATAFDAAFGPAALSLADQHRQAILALAGSALVISTLVPAARLPAIAAALLVKGSYLAVSAAASALPLHELAQVLLLATAGAILVADARREARWNGVLPLRQES